MNINKSKLEQDKFVEDVLKPAGITDKKVLDAFLQVPRHEFVEPNFKSAAYEDRPLPIDQKQTISQPCLVALMTELLNLKGGEKVLEIGTGSGFQAAILSRLAKEVYTIDRIASLPKKAKKVCQKLGFKNIHFHTGDGTLGLAHFQPFDAIMVTAGANQIPQPLLDQLKIGGRLVIPIGDTLHSQHLKVLTKNKSSINTYEVSPVAFVALIGKHSWSENLKNLVSTKRGGSG